MSANKRPSTSSLRRFITSRPYVTVADIRRRFGLDDPDAMAHLQRNGTSAWVGLPEREATKLQELWHRDELGVELSVEVHAPVVVGVYPMRIARYVMEANGSGDRTGSNGMYPHRSQDAPAVTPQDRTVERPAVSSSGFQERGLGSNEPAANPN
jgi:hypothetical protein